MARSLATLSVSDKSVYCVCYLKRHTRILHSLSSKKGKQRNGKLSEVHLDNLTQDWRIPFLGIVQLYIVHISFEGAAQFCNVPNFSRNTVYALFGESSSLDGFNQECQDLRNTLFGLCKGKLCMRVRVTVTNQSEFQKRGIEGERKVWECRNSVVGLRETGIGGGVRQWKHPLVYQQIHIYLPCGRI